MGTIYLACFAHKKLHHAGHYIGYTENLEKRIKAHRSGRGSRLLAIIEDAGIDFEITRTWEGDRHLEHRLKRRHEGPRLCPKCKAQKRGAGRTNRPQGDGTNDTRSATHPTVILQQDYKTVKMV